MVGTGVAGSGGFGADRLYGRIIRYYMDKKGYTKEKANRIAQSVIRREAAARTCGNQDCRHAPGRHQSGSRTCLEAGCDCMHFVRG